MVRSERSAFAGRRALTPCVGKDQYVNIVERKMNLWDVWGRKCYREGHF